MFGRLCLPPQKLGRFFGSILVCLIMVVGSSVMSVDGTAASPTTAIFTGEEHSTELMLGGSTELMLGGSRICLSCFMFAVATTVTKMTKSQVTTVDQNSELLLLLLLNLSCFIFSVAW
jgi:hypothetical protein